MISTIKKHIAYIIIQHNFSLKKFACTISIPQTSGWGIGGFLKNKFAISTTNKGNNNNINYNNVGVGNSVYLTLPNSGRQKIIYPNGKVELYNSSSSDCSTLEEDSEKRLLEAEVAHLKDSIKVKDDLILCLKETIELLKT